MPDEIEKRQAGLEQFGGVKRRIATSMDMDDVNKRRVFMKAMQDCDAKLTEEVNMSFVATDYVAHDVSLQSKDTGEIVSATRLVIIDDRGLTHQCVSNTLLQSLQTVQFVYGPPPWLPGIKLTVKTRKNGERSIYWFDAEAV